MGVRLTELVMNCRDPERLATFWGAVLDYVELSRETPDDGIEIGPASGFGGAAPTIVFARSSTPRTGPLRLHIDVSPVAGDQAAELDRLLTLGAVPADVGQSGTENWHVLADPEGNEFCLLRRPVAALAESAGLGEPAAGC